MPKFTENSTIRTSHRSIGLEGLKNAVEFWGYGWMVILLVLAKTTDIEIRIAVRRN